MKKLSIVVALLLVGCGVEISIPDDAALSCEQDGDCPLGLVCDDRIVRCVVAPDLDPPRLLSATATSDTTVIIVFSEAVDPASVESAPFAVSPTLDVLTIVQVDETTWRMTTARQVGGRAYDVSVSGISDSANIAGPDSASFVGFGAAPDETPPTQLAPSAGAVVRQDVTTVIAWTAAVGAGAYTLDIATDPSFSLLTTVGTVVSVDTSFEFNPAAEGTYYWRVRADITDPSATLPVGTFDVVTDAVKVYCAAGTSCDQDPMAPEAGNAGRPFRSLERALSAADRLGFTEVRVAARGASESYLSGATLISTDISILGGYDSTFVTAARDTQANATVLRGATPAGAIRYINVTDNVVLEGFTLQSNGPDAFALDVSSEAPGLLIRDCRFENVNATGFAGGVRVTDVVTPGLEIQNSVFSVGGATFPAVGIFANESSLALRDCDAPLQSPIQGWLLIGQNIEEGTIVDYELERVTVSSTLGGGAEAILVRGANSVTIRDSQFTVIGDGTSAFLEAIEFEDVVSLSITGSRIFAGGSPVSNKAVDVRLASSGVTFTNNVVELFAVSGAENRAVSFSTDSLASIPPVAPQSVIGHNTIVIRGAASAIGFEAGENEASLINNLVVCESGQPHVAVQVVNGNPAAEVTVARNNGFKDCATLYVDSSGTGTTTVANFNALDGTGGTACDDSRYDGNFELSQTLGEIFTDPDGVSNDPTVDDNDLSLLLTSDPDSIANGGLDTTLMDCGPCSALYSCGAIQTDFAGTARDATPSIGAWEKP